MEVVRYRLQCLFANRKILLAKAGGCGWSSGQTTGRRGSVGVFLRLKSDNEKTPGAVIGFHGFAHAGKSLHQDGICPGEQPDCRNRAVDHWMTQHRRGGPFCFTGTVGPINDALGVTFKLQVVIGGVLQGYGRLGSDEREEASDGCSAEFPQDLIGQSTVVGPAARPMRGANKTGM